MSDQQKMFYMVDHSDMDYIHVFDEWDEASDFVLAEVLAWHGRTREPDTCPYIEKLTEHQLTDMKNDRRVREMIIHTIGDAA